MENLLTEEVLEAFKRFNKTSKLLIGQFYYEEIKNGKILKELNKRKTDCSYFNTLRKQEEC